MDSKGRSVGAADVLLCAPLGTQRKENVHQQLPEREQLREQIPFGLVGRVSRLGLRPSETRKYS